MQSAKGLWYADCLAGTRRFRPEEITAITGSQLSHTIGHRASPNCVLLPSSIAIKFLHIICSLDMDCFNHQTLSAGTSWYLWIKHIKLSEPLTLRLVFWSYSLIFQPNTFSSWWHQDHTRYLTPIVPAPKTKMLSIPWYSISLFGCSQIHELY